MTDLLRTGVAFIIVLGGMVIIHEFGHFIVAKMFRIRVDVFSVGFGNRLFGWKKGDTDYRVSLIPLGGYVKLAGETTEEELTGEPWEFMSHPKWQQLCVMFAGPAMNLLTALAIPAVVLMIHYEQPAYMTKPAAVGYVEAGSPAAKAGLRIGDLITDVDGYKNPTWEDFSWRIALNPDHPMKLTVKRGDEIEHVEYTPEGMTEDRTRIGINKGLGPVLSPKARLYVRSVQKDSPAENAGLKAGDQFIAINGHVLQQDGDGANDLVDAIRGSNGNPVTLEVKRDNRTIPIQATPRMDDGYYRIGFSPAIDDGEISVTRMALPAAIKRSYHQNIEIIRLTELAIAQVFQGQRSAGDTVAGPIQIFKFTGDAAKEGILSILSLMAILSLNLGIFNLFPIPILDGGRIFMIGLDATLGVIGLRLSRVAKERMMQVGFFVIVALMAFVIINDIRHVIPSKPDAQQTGAPAQGK